MPMYLNDMFWAGMVSTQMSEGMHAYFDDYLSSSSSLKQFMEQYDIAISKKVQKEFIAEFESKTKLISLKTYFVWEEQFREAYTNVMFGKVQDEIDRIIYCTIVPTDGSLVLEVGAEKYNVLERNIGRNAFTREFIYSVDYHGVGQFLNCNCKKFEFMGIICCHIFRVMTHLVLQDIHDRYILDRWRIDVFIRHCSIFFRRDIRI